MVDTQLPQQWHGHKWPLAIFSNYPPHIPQIRRRIVHRFRALQTRRLRSCARSRRFCGEVGVTSGAGVDQVLRFRHELSRTVGCLSGRLRLTTDLVFWPEIRRKISEWNSLKILCLHDCMFSLVEDILEKMIKFRKERNRESNCWQSLSLIIKKQP